MRSGRFVYIYRRRFPETESDITTLGMLISKVYMYNIIMQIYFIVSIIWYGRALCYSNVTSYVVTAPPVMCSNHLRSIIIIIFILLPLLPIEKYKTDYYSSRWLQRIYYVIH